MKTKIISKEDEDIERNRERLFSAAFQARSFKKISSGK